jgi:hypothetical protein
MTILVVQEKKRVNLTVNSIVNLEVNLMKFIEPKEELGKKVDWKISEHTRAIVKYYAEYTRLNEDEIVDRFLKNILEDENFLDWVNRKRRNTRMIQQLMMNEEKKNG